MIEDRLIALIDAGEDLADWYPGPDLSSFILPASVRYHVSTKPAERPKAVPVVSGGNRAAMSKRPDSKPYAREATNDRRCFRSQRTPDAGVTRKGSRSL